MLQRSLCEAVHASYLKEMICEPWALYTSWQHAPDLIPWTEPPRSHTISQASWSCHHPSIFIQLAGPTIQTWFARAPGEGTLHYTMGEGSSQLILMTCWQRFCQRPWVWVDHCTKFSAVGISAKTSPHNTTVFSNINPFILTRSLDKLVSSDCM